MFPHADLGPSGHRKDAPYVSLIREVQFLIQKSVWRSSVSRFRFSSLMHFWSRFLLLMVLLIAGQNCNLTLHPFFRNWWSCVKSHVWTTFKRFGCAISVRIRSKDLDQGHLWCEINTRYWTPSSKPQRASPSYKIADCELSNSYLLTHKIFSNDRFFNFFWIA